MKFAAQPSGAVRCGAAQVRAWHMSCLPTDPSSLECLENKLVDSLIVGLGLAVSKSGI